MNKGLKFFFLMSLSTTGLATELTHHFANPSFIGGNPNDGVVLLNQANAQNSFKAPPPNVTKKTPLQIFSDQIQKALLNSLVAKDTTALLHAIIDPTTGQISAGQTVTAGGYTITTTDNGVTGYDILISDGISNTTITVPYTSTK